MRKRSPKEIIESEKNPELEQAYIKFPGKKLIPAGFKRREDSAEWDGDKIDFLLKKYGQKNYTEVHTHPYGSPFPSSDDIEGFLEDNESKTMVVVPTHERGMLIGYFFLRKTKNTPKIVKKDDLKKHGKSIDIGEPEEIKEGLKSLCKKYHLSYRFVPAKNVELGEELRFLKSSRLETKVASIIAISSIALSLFFLSPNLTGNTIANLTNQTSSIIGAGLFVLGIVGSYFYFKKRSIIKEIKSYSK